MRERNFKVEKSEWMYVNSCVIIKYLHIRVY